MADRFISLLDMFDGGGTGAEGNTFKGGGLLSDIANALFQPAGYRERQRGMAETRPQARPMSMGTQPVQPMSAPTPAPTPQPNPMASGMTPENAYVLPQQYSTSGINPANAYVPPPPSAEMQYSGRGSAGMPMPQFAQTPQEREVIEYLRSIGAIDY